MNTPAFEIPLDCPDGYRATSLTVVGTPGSTPWEVGVHLERLPGRSASEQLADALVSMVGYWLAFLGCLFLFKHLI